MVSASFTLPEDYWETLQIQEEDIEFLYNRLMETEIPLTSWELTTALVEGRILREKRSVEEQRTSGGDTYKPVEHYKIDQRLVFPIFAWRKGKVVSVRPGQNPDLGDFQVIKVDFENGEQKEMAAGLDDHKLNQPIEIYEDDESLNFEAVIDNYADILLKRMEETLENNPDFIRIAGRWFPKALLVDINTGHLNLAEAVLDMQGGGPLPTSAFLSQIGLSEEDNQKLVMFSLDLGLQEDPRFDEVGPAGEVLWYLHRLEPPEVLEVPVYLRYQEIEHDRSLLTEDMLALERDLDDELSPLDFKFPKVNEVKLPLLFPHLRAGTLPLSGRIRHLFPTAYEAPRIRFILVDGETGEKFPGWVVRKHRYIFGLRQWYEKHGLMPGSNLIVKRGEKPGEVIVRVDGRRSNREWVRTVLVGSDGGIVYAMLKQTVEASFDERMSIAVPDPAPLDQIWTRIEKDRTTFERIVVNTVRELSKLNPQSHVHATELYAAVNIVKRCPPAPILALLTARPWFVHVGDLHYRFEDSEKVLK
jgi:hypothetical protein